MAENEPTEKRMLRMKFANLIARLGMDVDHPAASPIDEGLRRLEELERRLTVTADGVPVVPGMPIWSVFDPGNGRWLKKPYVVPRRAALRLERQDDGETYMLDITDGGDFVADYADPEAARGQEATHE